MTNPSPPRDQVVEAMALSLAHMDRGEPDWIGMTEDERDVYREQVRAPLQAALSTGLLKLVEERPEMTTAQQIDEFAHPQEPRTAEKRQLAKNREEAVEQGLHRCRSCGALMPTNERHRHEDPSWKPKYEDFEAAMEGYETVGEQPEDPPEKPKWLGPSGHGRRFGHQPEGEPPSHDRLPDGSSLESEEIEAQPEGPSEAAVNAGVRLLPELYMGTAHTDYTAIQAILEAAYAIDHPQDRT